MKWIFIWNKSRDVLYHTSIIILSDLNCRGYCFIMLCDSSIPRGLKEKNTEIWFKFACGHIPVLLSNLLVKDKELLQQTHCTSHYFRSSVEFSIRHHSSLHSDWITFWVVLPVFFSFLGNCTWGQTKVAIIILRFALQRAIEGRGEAIESRFNEDDVGVDETACDIAKTEIKLSWGIWRSFLVKKYIFSQLSGVRQPFHAT